MPISPLAVPANVAAARALPLGTCAAVAVAVMLGVPVPARAQRADSTRAGVTQPARPGRPPAVLPADSVAGPPVSPRRAFLYSLAVPGLGQMALDRPNAAAFFVGIEMMSVVMARKTVVLLNSAKRLSADSVTVGFAPSAGAAAELLDPVTGDVTAVECESGEPSVADDSLPDGTYPILCGTRFSRERVAARRQQYEDWIAALLFNHLVSGADAFVAAQLWDLPGEVSFRLRPRWGGGMMVSASFPW